MQLMPFRLTECKLYKFKAMNFTYAENERLKNQYYRSQFSRQQTADYRNAFSQGKKKEVGKILKYRHFIFFMCYKIHRYSSYAFILFNGYFVK